MFLVIVPKIFKSAMRVSCDETTSKVACEISVFYKFVENSLKISLYHWYALKISSRDFKIFPSITITSLEQRLLKIN